MRKHSDFLETHIGLKCYEGFANCFKIFRQPQKEGMDKAGTQNVETYRIWVTYMHGGSLFWSIFTPD